jgi:hypothetical protein
VAPALRPYSSGTEPSGNVADEEQENVYGLMLNECQRVQHSEKGEAACHAQNLAPAEAALEKSQLSKQGYLTGEGFGTCPGVSPATRPLPVSPTLKWFKRAGEKMKEYLLTKNSGTSPDKWCKYDVALRVGTAFDRRPSR